LSKSFHVDLEEGRWRREDGGEERGEKIEEQQRSSD
jgi:hypothetical protein